MKQVVAYANANIALVKYWGKADVYNNIPQVPSVSMTLDGLGTRTILSICDEDLLFINDKPAQEDAFKKYKIFLDKTRKTYNFKEKFKAISYNNIPYEAGLASSASSFAALAFGLNKILDLGLNKSDVSGLARLGSASAARSIFGGFVALKDMKAYQVEVKKDFLLSMMILLISEEKKEYSSTQAMQITSKTSPFFNAFVENSMNDFNDALEALFSGNFVLLGQTMEHSFLKMHASMWVAKPSINFLKPKSFQVIESIYKIRDKLKDIVFFTADAGPNIKILVENHNLLLVKNYIEKDFPDIKIIISSPGLPAYVE